MPRDKIPALRTTQSNAILPLSSFGVWISFFSIIMTPVLGFVAALRVKLATGMWRELGGIGAFSGYRRTGR